MVASECSESNYLLKRMGRVAVAAADQIAVHTKRMAGF